MKPYIKKYGGNYPQYNYYVMNRNNEYVAKTITKAEAEALLRIEIAKKDYEVWN